MKIMVKFVGLNVFQRTFLFIWGAWSGKTEIWAMWWEYYGQGCGQGIAKFGCS